MTRLLGLAPLTYLELAPPDMVSCAASAGFDFVGLRLIPATPEEAQHASVGDTPLVRETARRLADTGLQLLDIEIFRLQPETRVADFEAALATGARLGASQATVAGQDADFQRLLDRFGQLCDIASQFGIQCNLEPTPWIAVSNIAAAARLIRAAGRSNAGIVVDPIHFDRVADDVQALGGYPAAYFPFMQLCDAPAERPTDLDTLLYQARAERLMPGEGGIDLQALVRALPAQIPLSLEIPMRTLAKDMPALERTRRMRHTTRQWLARLDAGELSA